MNRDLALNILQWLICHKTKLNQTNLLNFITDKVLSVRKPGISLV